MRACRRGGRRAGTAARGWYDAPHPGAVARAAVEAAMSGFANESIIRAAVAARTGRAALISSSACNVSVDGALDHSAGSATVRAPPMMCCYMMLYLDIYTSIVSSSSLSPQTTGTHALLVLLTSYVDDAAPPYRVYILYTGNLYIYTYYISVLNTCGRIYNSGSGLTYQLSNTPVSPRILDRSESDPGDGGTPARFVSARPLIRVTITSVVRPRWSDLGAPSSGR